MKVSTANCAMKLLNGEIFYTLKEAQILSEQCRRYYNTERPHTSLGYLPPAPKAILPRDARLAYGGWRASLMLGTEVRI